MKRALIAGVCLLSSAATAAAAPDSITQRYEHARETLDQSRASETATQAERDRLNAEARALSERLVANAARVQMLEGQVAESERQLSGLSQQAATLEAELAHGRDRMARVLAVLQRVDNDEPPALTLRPDDSLAAARGVMLVGTLLQPVYAAAHVIAVKLNALNATRAAIVQKRGQARAEQIALNGARQSLAALQVQRTRDAARANLRLGEIHSVTEEIAHNTRDLKSLIDRIATVRAESNPATGMVVVSAQSTAQQTLRPGSLLKPVVGRMAAGDPSGPGTLQGTAQGLWFEAGGAAEVVAPIDAEVVYAGTYQKFGPVLILEMAGGYHLLLAHMGRIDVRLGDLMLAGEPVGVLSPGRTARLYMELRHNGGAVNVAPWMRVELRKARGT